jgi:HEAT repeat protein
LANTLNTLYYLRLISTILAFTIGASTGTSLSHSGQQTSEIEKQKLRLSSADVEERRDAVMRLGALHRVDASRAVVTALADPSPLVRVVAAVAVSILPPDESAADLIPLLSDKDPFVRQAAAYALGGNHNHNAVTALIERLSGDKDDRVRGAAAVALGKTRDEAAVVPLAQVLSPASSSSGGKRKGKENQFVLRAAAGALGEIGNRAAVPALIETLSNESVAEDVRREAAQALGLIGDPSAAPALQAAASASDPYLSRIAFEALHKIELREPKKRS